MSQNKTKKAGERERRDFWRKRVLGKYGLILERVFWGP
jgi:hypothetical protein